LINDIHPKLPNLMREGLTMPLQSIQPASLWDSSPYLFSQIVKFDRPKSLVFISGQVALDRSGSLVGVGNVDAQLRQVFANIQAGVEAAGGTLDDIASLTVYLTRIAHHQNYLALLKEVFPERRPAETLVQVAALGLPELEVEIQAVAVMT
jgi:2-iminobutanoate/2-iminopropanoate deaminase